MLSVNELIFPMYGVLFVLQGEWLLPKARLHTLVAAIDWDGRMRPFLAELLQHKLLIAQVKLHACSFTTLLHLYNCPKDRRRCAADGLVMSRQLSLGFLWLLYADGVVIVVQFVTLDTLFTVSAWIVLYSLEIVAIIIGTSSTVAPMI